MEKREKGKYDFSLDNRQVGLIVSGLLLVLALSFLLGTLFGRNLGKMADSGQPAVSVADATTTEAADLSAMSDGSSELATGDSVAPATLDGGTSARDSLIATLESQKPSLDQPPIDAPDPAPDSAEYQPPPAPPSTPIATTPPAPEPAATPPKPTPAPEPETPRTVVPAGSYTIQIASAPNKAEAQALVNELRAKKFDAYMIPAALPNGTFYRVRVGHYSSLDQAEKARKILQMRESKYYDAWITQ